MAEKWPFFIFPSPVVFSFSSAYTIAFPLPFFFICKFLNDVPHAPLFLFFFFSVYTHSWLFMHIDFESHATWQMIWRRKKFIMILTYVFLFVVVVWVLLEIIRVPENPAEDVEWVTTTMRETGALRSRPWRRETSGSLATRKNDGNNYKLLAIKPDRQPERVVMTTVRPAKIFRTKSSRTLNTSESYHQNPYTHCFQWKNNLFLFFF